MDSPSPPSPTPTLWAAPASDAYGGVPADVPGLIIAAKFDHGGEGEAYSDTDVGNNGGVFRPNEDVDISGDHNGYHVAWIRTGEFLRYTVNVEEAASAFDFEFRVAAPADLGGAFRIVSGGTGCNDYTIDLSGLVTVPSTGGWGSFESLIASGAGNGGLAVGRASLWLCVVSSSFNIESFNMRAVVTPTPIPPPDGDDNTNAFGGIPAIVPGTIQAEDFDSGGEGVGYSDTDLPNNGGAYRTEEAVDISVTGDQDGYNVGWIRAGEFLRYTVDVRKAASAFDFKFQVAAPPAKHDLGTFRVVSGGTGCDDYTVDLSGLVTVPSTGGWGNFACVTSERGSDGLPVGRATIWLCVVSAGFNIDSFTLTAAA